MNPSCEHSVATRSEDLKAFSTGGFLLFHSYSSPRKKSLKAVGSFFNAKELEQIDKRLQALFPEKIPAHEVYDLDLSAERNFTVATLADHPSTFDILKTARKIVTRQREKKNQTVVVFLHEFDEKVAGAWIDALTSAEEAQRFEYPKYGKKAEKKTATSKSQKGNKNQIRLHFFVASDFKKRAETIIQQSFHQGVANNLIRTLTTMPANKLNPKSYVEKASDIARRRKLNVEFIDQKALKGLGAGAFLAVSQGSMHKDAGILKISYSPKTAKKHLCLVGKGITYDTGGVNVKPATFMNGMQGDMAGSAIVLALIDLIAKESWPVKVNAYLAIAENDIGSKAYRPNEIVISANGTSIETIHTDAEGRMVLSDTLTIASRERPDFIMDFATLTGSAVAAIGTTYGAAFTNKSDLHPSIIKSGIESGERVWPFPIDDDFAECLESDIADTKQCRIKGGVDHIEAAMFLKKFIETPEKIQWVHIDLSASENEGGLAHIPTKETGFGVRFSVHFLKTALGIQ